MASKPLNKKTEQLLVYITKGFKSASITILMKLAYLVDLITVTRGKEQISSFQYRRYKYGPFNSEIYAYLTKLVEENIFEDLAQPCPPSEEYIVYKVNEKSDKISFDKLSADERKIIDEVVDSMSGYGAKTITEVTYKTKPMIALGATLGGTENLNTILNLRAK